MNNPGVYGEGPDGLPVGRLPMLDDDAAAAAAAKAGIDPKYLTQPIWRVLLHRPKLAAAVYQVLTDLLFRGSLDARVRELMILRIGWSTRSVFEWTQHWKIALDAGVEPGDLLAVRTLDGSRLSVRDLAALAAAEDVVSGGEVTRTTWNRLQEHFDHAELLEVVAVATTWTWVSTLLRSLDVPLDDGMAAWPPHGTGPDESSA
jgi:alkylhydroperoxidase family enzyme